MNKKAIIALISIQFLLNFGVSAADGTPEQRKAFLKAMAFAAEGNAEALVHEKSLLSDYILKPDIQATYLKNSIKKQPNKVIVDFLARHPDNATSNQVLRSWLDHLYKTKQWKTYLNHFPTTNLSETSAGRQCEHMLARIRSSVNVDLSVEALPLWMIGKSQTSQCDPLFEIMKNKGLLTKQRLQERINLSLERAQFGLANYLTKPLMPKDREWSKKYISAWQKMSFNPNSRLKASLKWPNNEPNRNIVAYGIKKQARLDIKKALPLWEKLAKHYSFSTNQTNEINNYLALRAAYQRNKTALKQYAKADAESRSLRESEWQVRNALWHQDWQAVINAIDGLPTGSQTTTQWRYWKARAYEALGQPSYAKQLYTEVASEKGYFSYLSADRINRAYNFPSVNTLADESTIQRLSKRLDFRRAREWHAVSKLGFSRSEWRSAVRKIPKEEKAQAAILAARWKLPTNSIRSAVNSAAINDIKLMYPIEFKNHVDQYAKAKGLEPAWVMGLIRQESLFMQDVRSSANAYGLMQLLPSTAKQTAKRNKIKYAGYSHLISPKHNIRLGTAYLAQVSNRLQSNPALASAAYNGGPHRVKKWLPETKLPADIWIENIVFNETRNYVQKVMENKVIYSSLMYSKPIRLSDILVDVKPNS